MQPYADNERGPSRFQGPHFGLKRTGTPGFYGDYAVDEAFPSVRMPDLSEAELTALRLMMEKPIRIHALADVQGREEAAAVLDGLARKGLCRRTLEGLNRVYTIAPEGQDVLWSL